MKTIDQLKKQVIGPSDLNESFHYFFDIMEDPQFRGLGTLLEKNQIKKNTMLQSLLFCMQETISKAKEKKVKIVAPYLLEAKEYNLIHGFYKITMDPQLMFTVVYFTDVHTGMFSMSNLEGDNDYFRFSLTLTHQKSTTIH